MLYFLAIGALLGLSSGLAPGPLLALVVSETLRRNVKAGITIALTPILTDPPIIVLTLLLLSKLASFHRVLGTLSLVGGLFILSMGIAGLRATGLAHTSGGAEPGSLAKGILANLLNPHPYLFWFSVGAPLMTRASDHGPGGPLIFLAGFYACLVGSKSLVAVIIGRSKSWLSGNTYLYAMRGLGLALVVLAVFLFLDGLKLWGIPVL